MLVRFDIKDYRKVYDILVEDNGYEQDMFETDDCMQIENKAELKEIKRLLPTVKFKVVQ